MIGAICGAANNLIYGLTTGDNITLIYALTSLCVLVWLSVFMAQNGIYEHIPKSPLSDCTCAGGLAAVLVSTPLNIMFWGGTTGNVWGDAVFAATQAGGTVQWHLVLLLDEIVVDVPDKIITIIIVYFYLTRDFPKKLTALCMM